MITCCSTGLHVLSKKAIKVLYAHTKAAWTSNYETLFVSSEESWRGQFPNIAKTSMHIGMQCVKSAMCNVAVPFAYCLVSESNIQ